MAQFAGLKIEGQGWMNMVGLWKSVGGVAWGTLSGDDAHKTRQ